MSDATQAMLVLRRADGATYLIPESALAAWRVPVEAEAQVAALLAPVEVEGYSLGGAYVLTGVSHTATLVGGGMADGLFAVLMQYQKLMNQEAREDRKLPRRP